VGFKVGNQTVIHIEAGGATVIESAPYKDVVINGEVYIDDSSIASEGGKIVAVLDQTLFPTGDIAAYVDSQIISISNAYITADDAIVTTMQDYTDTAILNATFSAGGGAAASYVDTAEADAIAAASLDATTKASAAQANAISFSSADSSTKATAAQTTAISTASTDATTKSATTLAAANAYTDAAIDQANLVPLLTATVQDLIARIEALEA
jgi:hypothetical protein